MASAVLRCKFNSYLTSIRSGAAVWQRLSSSTAQTLTKVELNPQTKIATLTLNRLPANALSLELMQQIRADVEQLQTTPCRGVVLTSASERIFCAGLDLREVHSADEPHLRIFWQALQQMWRTVFATKLPIAALINGHAVAGGCMLATCCDYRVMLPHFIIGLNETKAGVPVPKYVIDAYVNVMPSIRRAEADLVGGLVYKTDEALAVGLVDAIATTKEAGMQKCLDYFATYKGVSDTARGLTKVQFRSGILRDFENGKDADLANALKTLQGAEFKQFLADYLKTLGKNKNK